jgi:hypothetical protein
MRVECPEKMQEPDFDSVQIRLAHCSLKRGGADSPENMQWQTVAEARAKDRIEWPSTLAIVAKLKALLSLDA